MSLIEYANRKYDYLALQNVNPARKTRLGLELFNADTSGAICVGIQKLAQRWLLEFMTEVGSMPGLPERGCSFMRAARTGKFLTRRHVETEFVRANIDVRRNLQAEEYDDMPDDEKFASAELLNSVVVPENIVGAKTATSAAYLNITVKINSLAGDSRQIIVPVDAIPQA